MHRKVTAFCALMTLRRVIIWGLVFAIFFEAITIGLRFGLLLESTRDTAMIGNMTLGLRIHHGYIGLFLILLGIPFPKGIRHGVWIVGIGLLLSDLLHHFLVLWIWFGSPQFDLVYPNHPYWTTQPVLPRESP